MKRFLLLCITISVLAVGIGWLVFGDTDGRADRQSQRHTHRTSTGTNSPLGSGQPESTQSSGGADLAEVVLRGGHQLDSALPKLNVIRGRVLRDGKPARATVSLHSRDGSPHTETDSDGRFLFEDLEAAPYRILARAGEEVAEAYYQLWATAPNHEVVMELEPGAFLELTVEDDEGGLLPGAEIQVDGKGLKRHGEQVAATDGTARLGPFPKATLRLEVSAPNHQLEIVDPVTVEPPHETKLRVRLLAAAEGRGEVLDEDGQPVPGAVIKAILADGHSRSPIRIPKERTDSAGLFVLHGVPPGPVDLEVHHEHFIDRRLEITLPDTEIEIILKRGCRVVGRVLDFREEGVGGAAVSAIVTSKKNRFMSEEVATSTAGATGHFELDGLPEGKVVLSAKLPGDEHRDHNLAITELEPCNRAESEEVLLRFEKGRILEGRVVNAKGEGISGVRLFREQIVPSADGARSGGVGFGETTSRADGHFRLEGLGSARVEISVADNRYRLASEQGSLSFEPEATDVRIIVEGVWRFMGRVVDETRRPIPRFQVGDFTTVQDDAGRFEVTAQARKTFEIEFSSEGYANEVIQVTPSGETTDLGEVVLRRGLVLEGKVIGRKSKVPVPGAQVFLAETERQVQEIEMYFDLLEAKARQQTRTNPDGTFRLEGVSPTRTTVYVDHPDYLPRFVPVAAPKSDLVIEIDRGSIVRGRIVGAEDKALGGTPVHAVTGGRGEETQLDPAGHFELTGLEAGDCTIQVTMLKDGTRFGPARLTLPPGGSVDATIEPVSNGVALRLKVWSSEGKDLTATARLIAGNHPAPQILRALYALQEAGISGGELDSEGLTFEGLEPGLYTLLVPDLSSWTNVAFFIRTLVLEGSPNQERIIRLASKPDLIWDANPNVR